VHRLRLNRRTGAAAAIMGCALAAIYLALVFYTSIDSYLFPANELKLPQVSASVPGTGLNVDVALPGISTSGPKPWTPDARLNILVLGLDRRPEDPPDTPARSDSIFVASIDKVDGRVQLLAIPRDLWAEIPYGNTTGVWAKAKINSAHNYGQFYRYPGGGPAAAVAAIEHNYHIDIHHYIVIDWVGFVRLIDAVGGIDIEVPEPISDYATDVLDAFPRNTVQAGLQHMDGTQALGYSRVRVDGDIKRIERQQLVIKAVASQATKLGLITKLPEMWSAYNDAIKTDVTTGLIPGLGLLARQLDLDNMETFSLAPALYPGITEDGLFILLPNEDEMFSIIDQFLADPKTRDERPVIVIEYMQGGEARAREAKAHFVTFGVPPEFIRLAKGDSAGEGIFATTARSYTAAKLTGITNLRLLNAEDGLPEGIDILVRIGDGTELKKP
jgi:polyisoprenyl-teichoic acid--peptidoglycan teichoic acid transferase